MKRTVVDARNPSYANADSTVIDIEVKFQELSALGYIPFTASPSDPEVHGRSLFAAAENGNYGTIAPYVPPPEPEPTPE